MANRCKPSPQRGPINAAALTLSMRAATLLWSPEGVLAFTAPTAIPTAAASISRRRFMNDNDNPSSAIRRHASVVFPSSSALFERNESATGSAKETNPNEKYSEINELRLKLNKLKVQVALAESELRAAAAARNVKLTAKEYKDMNASGVGLKGNPEKKHRKQKEQLSKKIRSLSDQLRLAKIEAEMHVSPTGTRRDEAKAALEAENRRLLGQISDLKSELKDSIDEREREHEALERELAASQVLSSANADQDAERVRLLSRITDLESKLKASVDLREQERQKSQEQLAALKEEINVFKSAMTHKMMGNQGSKEPQRQRQQLVRESGWGNAQNDLVRINRGGPDVIWHH